MGFHSSLTLSIAMLGLLLLAVATEPASYCLGNCADCPLSNPTQCLNYTNSNGQTYPCIPYYEGTNCAQSTPSRFVPME